MARLPSVAWAAVRRPEALPSEVAREVAALGPLFVKAAQVLSTRRDLLGPRWIGALAGLRSQVPPTPAAQMERHVRRHLDRAAFAALEPEPVAAGSVAQVYRGQLLTGERVAVKVLRPGVRVELERDLAATLACLRVAARLSPRLRALNLEALCADFREMLAAQLDLRHEAALYQRFRALGDRELHLPRVFEALSSEQVLVVEWIDAIAPERAEELGIPPARLAARLDGAVERMIFRYGLVHGDLHPGNFYWSARGQLVLVDLGIAVELSEVDRIQLTVFCVAFLDGFYDVALRYFLDHFTEELPSRAGAHRARAAEEIGAVIHRTLTRTGGAPDFAGFFYELTGALLRYGLRPRARQFNVIMTTLSLDGYLRGLDPTFNTLMSTQRRRQQEREQARLTPGAELELFGEEASAAPGHYPTSGLDLAAAAAARDALVVEWLCGGGGGQIVHVECGRGAALERIRAAGGRPFGLTLTTTDLVSCRQRGIPCARAPWDQLPPGERPAGLSADGGLLLEPLLGLSNFHELEAGLSAARLTRLLAWMASVLPAGGRVFCQSMVVMPALLTDPTLSAEREVARSALSHIGLATDAMIDVALRPFRVVARWDHSGDLAPFLEEVQRRREVLCRRLEVGLFIPEGLVQLGRALSCLEALRGVGLIGLRRLTLEVADRE